MWTITVSLGMVKPPPGHYVITRRLTMSAALVSRSRSSFTLQIEIPYTTSMLEFEESIQSALNEGGVLATEEALRTFDADGSPIVVGQTRLTSKGQTPKEYQTP